MEKIDALRQKMKEHGVQAYLLPHADEFQNEHLPARAERLSWLTGFTGSAGYAAILSDKAAVFVDGRYTLQVRDQVDANLYAYEDYTKTHPWRWVLGHLNEGDVLGLDPKLWTAKQVSTIEKACTKKNIKLSFLRDILVDEVWADQPDVPMFPIFEHEASYAGRAVFEKLNDVCKKTKEARADWLVISMLDSIAWLTNLRGSDVNETPVFISYALVDVGAQKLHLFVDQRKIKDVLDKTIIVHDFSALERFFAEEVRGGNVLIDKAEAAQYFVRLAEENNCDAIDEKNPVTLLKACKNKTERNAVKEAHIIDAQAVVKFLCWFDQEKNSGGLTELSAEDRLTGYRKESNQFHGISFEPISGFGPNGAVVHYRATEQTNLPIKGNGLYLIDSGGQYQKGTTDITRTVAVGAATEEMRERYTDVLKGHIALAMAVFPEGTSGAQLDYLARKPLWDKGLDYAHGTGHGVGMFLNVHEGPAGITPKSFEPLREGMLLSNEPGYYKEGAFGIRIENLVLVQKVEGKYEDGRGRLCFETVSYVPLDKNLIIRENLSDVEIEWVNSYHTKVFELISPAFTDDQERLTWLRVATQSI